MGDSTSISWTDATWNVTRGCRRVSAGCENCYAERQANRFKGTGKAYEGLIKLVGGKPRWSGETKFAIDHLEDPLHWRSPRRVFVDSMSDLFYEGFTDEQIAAVFAIMAAAPQHTFQVLTKRSKRMRDWFRWFDETGYSPGHVLAESLQLVTDDAYDEEWAIALTNVVNGWSRWKQTPNDGNPLNGSVSRWPLANVWLGVSTENQETYVERVRDLHGCRAVKHFISAEPLLWRIDMSADLINPAWLNWVIAGCESGPGARFCSIEWLRSLRDQCAAASVPFFLKQAVWERDDLVLAPDDAPAELVEVSSSGQRMIVPLGWGPGSKVKGDDVIELPYLDGVQHAAFPEVARG